MTSESSLKNKTAKGLFWGGISSSFQQIFQIIFGIIMLRLLSPEEYGIVGMLLIFHAISWLLLDPGLGTAIVNKKNATQKDYNALFGFSAIISVTCYTILFFAAPYIADFYENPVLTNVARVYFLSILISGFSVSQSVYLFKEIKNKERAIIDFSSLSISGIIGVILAFNGYSYWALVIQHLLNICITVSLRWLFVPWRPSLKIDLSPLKNMFSFSIKLFLSGIITSIANNIFSLLLGKFYNETQVGLYSQGNKWATMGSSFINGMMNSVMLPVLTQVKENKERQRNVFRKMLRFGSFLSFPIILGLAFVGEEFLLIVGRDDSWLPAAPFLQLFCIWYAFSFILTLYTNLVLTHGRSDVHLWGSISIGGLQLCIIGITFPFGIFPMIIAYLCTNIVSILFWHYFTNKLIGLKIFQIVKDISPYLIITLVSIAISWFITMKIEPILLKLILKIVITATIYITTIWFSNSVIIKECYYFFRKTNSQKYE